MFEKNYIEFIWVDDHELCKKNDPHLYKRLTGDYCKHGICYRGKLRANQEKDFVLTKTEYLDNGEIWDLQKSISNLELPLIFVIDLNKDKKDYWPINNDKLPKQIMLKQSFEKYVEEQFGIVDLDYLKNIDL